MKHQRMSMISLNWKRKRKRLVLPGIGRVSKNFIEEMTFEPRLKGHQNLPRGEGTKV